jgi:hypothetical protein
MGGPSRGWAITNVGPSSAEGSWPIVYASSELMKQLVLVWLP